MNTGGLVRTVDVGTGSTLTWTSQTVTANSAAGFTKNGAGTWNMGALTWSTNMNGGFTLNNGTVSVTGAKALGNGTLTINGGTLQSSNSNTFPVTSLTIGGDFTFAGTGTDLYGATVPIGIGGATRTITNSTTASNAVRNLAGVITGTGSAGIVVNGTGLGVITLSNAANNFAGGVTLAGSTVSISSLGNIGSGNLTFNGGVLQVTGNTLTSVDPRIANPASFNGGFDINDPTNNFTVGVALGGSGNLSKSGTGKLTLMNANTYAGNTTITAGTLQLSNSGSIANSQKITVNGATTNFDVTAVSGFTVGTQILTGNNGNVLGNTTLGSTSSFLQDFNDLAANAAVKFANDLTITPGSTLTFNGTPDGVSNYLVATYTGNLSGTFLTSLPAGYTIDYGTGSNSSITLIAAAVPEPASLALLGIGAAALLTRRRK
jgi:autotransporter-associated beta strand protein